MAYRLHEHGPLCSMVHEALVHDEPGLIKVVMTFRRVGDRVPGHIHAFEHRMHVTKGRVLVNTDATVPLQAGQSIVVPAGVRHGLVALAPESVVECVHIIRKENGEIDPAAFSADGIPLEWVRRLTIVQEVQS